MWWTTNSMSSRLETEDQEEAAGADSSFVPPGALAQAQEQEEARVTMHRALRTIARLIAARGFDITVIGGVPVTTPGSTAVADQLEVFRSEARAVTAEEGHEVVMEAVVHTPAAYTTAWANSWAPGTRLIVVVIDQGNMNTIQEITDGVAAMGVQTAILMSRKDLTAYSKKFLTDTDSCIEYFQYADVQAAICDHSLVPKHMVLNASMAATVRGRYVGGKFPRLLSYDPMVRFLGLKLGAVVAVREVFGREQPEMTYFEVADI
jgi:DNA-directed RNA polymerase subunit H (RpoH/RPB5)